MGAADAASVGAGELMGRLNQGQFATRGKPIRAQDFNALRRAIGQTTPFDLHGKLPRMAETYWIGQIVPEGPVITNPNGPGGQPESSDPMPDFADARYWVREVMATITKKLDGPGGPPVSSPTSGNLNLVHPQNRFDITGDLNELPHGRSAITAAINLNELDSNTHLLPWGTIVRVESWDVRSILPLPVQQIAPELLGARWNVFHGPHSIVMEVKIEKVVTSTSDAGGADANREIKYLQFFGPYFKVRRMIRNTTGNPAQPPIVDFGQWFVALPMRNIDPAKFQATTGAQIYNIDNTAQPTFLASNGARGLTLYHTTCATPLIAAPTPDDLCAPPALEV